MRRTVVGFGVCLILNLVVGAKGTAQAQAELREPLPGPVGEPGLCFRYFEASVDTTLDLPDLEPTRTGVVEEIAFPEGVRRDDFALEIFGAVEAPEDGVYTFTTESDDGSRLYIGDTLVVSNDYPHGAEAVSGEIGLRSGRHPIYVAYFEGVVDEVLKVSWQGPGIAQSAIPTAALTQHAQVVEFPEGGVTTTGLSWPDSDLKVNVRVDTRDAADLEEFHTILPELLREHYPKIVELIGTEDSVLPEELGFSMRPGIDVPAYASSSIVLSADWFRARPGDLGCVLHEVTHLVQRYPGFADKPGWLVEGIADYVRHVIDLDDGWRIPSGYREGQNYTDGYGTTAAFLAFLELEHGPGVMSRLNGSLKDRSYTPSLFEELTGSGLDELWEAYKADANTLK